jgi:universal stress protein A
VTDVSDYNNILVAADFSDGGEVAARRAANLAERFGARLTILHVLEHFPEDLPVDVIPPEDVDPQTYLTARIRGQLEKLSAGIGRPEAVLETVISTESASREIVQFAHSHDIDLIVLGCRDRQGMMATSGSTVSGVVHTAAVDVLAVRSKG